LPNVLGTTVIHIFEKKLFCHIIFWLVFFCPISFGPREDQRIDVLRSKNNRLKLACQVLKTNTIYLFFSVCLFLLISVLDFIYLSIECKLWKIIIHTEKVLSLNARELIILICVGHCQEKHTTRSEEIWVDVDWCHLYSYFLSATGHNLMPSLQYFYQTLIVHLIIQKLVHIKYFKS